MFAFLAKSPVQLALFVTFVLFGGQSLMKSNRALWILLLVWVFVAAIRVRLAPMPLERDEGEYAYMGQQMLRGVVPYAQAANMKWPGTYVFYAGIQALFGQSDVGIRLGLILVNAATGALLYGWAKALFDRQVAIWASLFFAVWSLSPSLLGMIGHATHFVSLCALGGIWVGQRAKTTGKPALFLWSGALFGLAMLMKQHGALLLLPALLGCFGGIGFSAGMRRALMLLLGAILPVAACFGWLWRSGVWEKFWFWTVDYARFYATSTPFSLVMRNLEANTGDFARDAALWGLALLGFYGLWRRALPHRGEISLWLAVSLAMTIPGFFFRPHYFVPAIPFLSLLAALFVRETGVILRENRIRNPRRVPRLIGAAALAITLFFHRAALFTLSPDEASQRIYRGEMFVQTKAIGLQLRAQMAPDESLAILGSEPQIAFYARRKLASEFLYTYNLVELQPLAPSMQRTMAGQIERAAPAILVSVRSERSWVIWPDSDRFIFSWQSRYQRDFGLQNEWKAIDSATQKLNSIQIWRRKKAN